jgi:crotonobetainyl-CoA:carnitine CoA-transferase CaiB-like acyl-CoA transferase
MPATDIDDALRGIWDLGFDQPSALASLQVQLRPPSLPSTFCVDTAASACIGAAALAAAQVWTARTGKAQQVSLESNNAALSYRSERYLRLNGEVIDHPAPEQSYFQDRDGRWMQLHMVYPHHRAGILSALGVPDERGAIAAKVASVDAVELETQLAALGLPAYAQRSAEEWQATEQAAALALLPLLQLEQIGDAPPLELPKDPSAILHGIRVLDMTRVIAGPVCGRSLAAHGADVMRIHPPHLTEIPGLLMDGGRGKRCANVNLHEPSDRAAFDHMLASAHVLVQGFRPGGIEGLGYGAEALAERHPGIVHVSLSAWSHAGPWAARHGFDSLVQTATGISHAGGLAVVSDRPRPLPCPLPCQVLDHSSGYLAAFAVLAALKRRIEVGGSWRVRLSLAQTGRWFDGLGRVDAQHTPEPDAATVAARMHLLPSDFGELTASLPVAQFSQTPPAWRSGPVALGANAAAW